MSEGNASSPAAAAGEHHEPTIEDYFTEERTFPPPVDFSARAVISDPGVYDEAARLGPEFWATQAGALDWYRPWDTVLTWEPPFARWFDGGTLNVSYNCLDRHVAAGRGDKVAYHWEGEPGIPGPSATRNFWSRCPSSPTCFVASEWSRATGWPSTCP